MLKLRKGKRPFVPVELGGGAVIRVRTAMYADVDEAAARAERILNGLTGSSEAGDALSNVLGDDFDISALDDQDRLAAAHRRLSEIYLVMQCQDGWSGVGSEDGTPIEEPDAASVALLLNDVGLRNRVMLVINQAVHEQVAEKNASAASPSGGADTQIGAPIAGATETPARSESSSTET